MWWWFGALGFVALLLAYGIVVDVRARRRGRRVTGDARVSRDAREDARAWRLGSLGHTGEDVSWMRSSRRRKGEP